MVKTTVYLPDELKRALGSAARRRGVSEALIIRQAVADAVAAESTPVRTAVFSSEVLLAVDVDRHLAGFGDQ